MTLKRKIPMQKQWLLVIIIVGSELCCLFIGKCFDALGTAALRLLLLPEFYFLNGGVQFLGEHSGKFHLLLDLEVSWIGYILHMDVGRSTSSLGENGHTSFYPRVGNDVNEWPCKLDGRHHECQCRSCVLEQWTHGSSWLQKLLESGLGVKM
jgi:hypothetical protein